MTDQQPQRPNYFQLLEIDPNAPWSDATFEQQLTTKKAAWTKGRNHPKHALRFKSYLDQVDEIRDLMMNPVRRAAEQEAAKQNIAQEQYETRKRFREELDLRAAKGFLTMAEVQGLLKAYGDTLTEQVVRAAVQQTNVEVRKDEFRRPDAETIDSSLAKNIATNLGIVGATDLYAFLGLSRTTRTSDLHTRANTVYADNQKQAQKTALVTARSDLAGQAMTIFADDTMRQRYDNTLAEQVYEDLHQAISQLAQGTKTIHAPQYEKLLERARSQGLDADHAEQVIRQRAQELQLALMVGDTSTTQQKLRCPNCGTLSDPDASHCSECATSLKIACPNCGAQMPTQHQACTNCGFPVGNLPNVEKLLQKARTRIDKYDLDKAADLIAEAGQQWSVQPGGHPPARATNDPATRTLAALQHSISEKRGAETEALEELQALVDERRFYAAQHQLRRLDRAIPGLDLSTFNDTVSKAINRAEAGLRRARAIEAGHRPAGGTRGQNPVDLYQQILWECRDCQAAHEALSRTPPESPGILQVTAGPGAARLRWQPSPARGVGYTIIRKAGSRPIAPSDGDTLATINGNTFDDTAPPVGYPVFYAVYTNREGVLSVDPAHADVPVTFTADVLDLTAQVDDGLIRLRWTTPSPVVNIEVRRGEVGPPQSVNEGTPIRVYGRNDAVDANLLNGKAYHYTVFAIFQAHDGSLLSSPGLSISAVPEQPPTIITELVVTRIGSDDQRDIRVNWPAPDKGDAILLHGERPPSSLLPGHAVPQDTLAQHGTITPAPSNEVVVPIKGSGIIYLTPAVLFQDMAYLGQTHAFTALDDVRDVRAQNMGFAIQLTWDWPDKVNNAIVAFHHDRYPDREDDDSVRIDLTRAEYDLHGRYLLHDPAYRDYFFTVFAAVPQPDGTRLIAPGTEPTCRARVSLVGAITITYTFSQPRRMLGPKNPLQLHVDAAGQGDLPEMALVRKAGGAPISRSDGQIIYRIAAQYLEKGQTTITVDLEDVPDDTPQTARLFLLDDAFYESTGGYVRISHPDQEHHEKVSQRSAPPKNTVTCPFCFTRYPPQETLFRCKNTRCDARTEDEIYAKYQGLVDVPRLGLVFPAEQVQSGNRLLNLGGQRPPNSATCPECTSETHIRVCPTCHYELLYDAGLTDERTIAIIGGRGTGKSNYIALLINRLENDLGAHFDAAIRAMGDRTRERYERDFYTPLFRQGRVITPTAAAGVDTTTRTPMIYRTTFAGGKSANLTLFDTAGEDMQSLSTMTTENRYILYADAIIFLLDPLQIPAVRQQLPNIDLPPTDPGAEPEYIVGRVREMYEQEYGLGSQDKITKPVAFTLSKIDLLLPLLDPASGLLRTGEHFGYVNMTDLNSIHAEVGAYLQAWMGPRFMNLVRANFANYHFFGVSSFGRPPVGNINTAQTINSITPIRVEDPILWLFTQMGLLNETR